MAIGLSAVPSFELWILSANSMTNPGWASVVLAAFCLVFVPTVRNIRPHKVTPQTEDGERSKEDEAAGLNHPHLNPISEEEHLLTLVPELDTRGDPSSEILYHIQGRNEDESHNFAMDSFSVYNPMDSHLINPLVSQEGEGVYPAKGVIDPNSLSHAHIATETNPYAKPSGTCSTLPYLSCFLVFLFLDTHHVQTNHCVP